MNNLTLLSIVIASEAKQSISFDLQRDCFVACSSQWHPLLMLFPGQDTISILKNATFFDTTSSAWLS